jgi:NitT/TauT family transport system substrate-binding protein
MIGPRSLSMLVVAALVLAVLAGTGPAQEKAKLTLAMSGWTGFAPLTLAKEKGLFDKNGIDLTIKKMPPANRHQAMAAGDVQVISTTVDTHILYGAAGVPVVQVMVIDSSTGGDGVVVKNDIGSFADLKGKTVAVQYGGVPQFWLAYLLKKHGMSLKDVKTSDLSPQQAATAFIAGQFDAAVTYEPYISAVRTEKAGKILVNSGETPGIIIDTLAFPPDYVKKNPKVVQAFVTTWFEALDWMKANPADAYRIMGADVKQTAEQFAASAKNVTWYDRKTNGEYLTTTMPAFLREASAIMLDAGLIKKVPDLAPMTDASYVK